MDLGTFEVARRLGTAPVPQRSIPNGRLAIVNGKPWQGRRGCSLAQVSAQHRGANLGHRACLGTHGAWATRRGRGLTRATRLMFKAFALGNMQ